MPRAKRGFKARRRRNRVLKAASGFRGKRSSCHAVANEAVQAMGATGYSQETLVEYCMRRCRGWMIAGGSLEMLRNRLAEEIFGRRFDQRGRRTDAG